MNLRENTKEEALIKKRKSPENDSEASPKRKLMMAQGTKTPITILQEICAKTNTGRNLPVYTELKKAPDEYEDQNFKFFIKCQALSLTAIGCAMTKKSAKHTAAENLLKKLQRNQNGDGDDMSDEDESATLDSDYISDLLDYCTVKDFHKPDFDCILSCGPSHAPSFTFRCSLDSIKKEATAETKKMAKQLSAKAILEEVKKCYPDLEKKLASYNNHNDTKEKVRQKVTTYRELKKQNKVDMMGTLIKDRCDFFRKQDEEFVKALREILFSNDNDKEKYEKLMKELRTMWNPEITDFEETSFKKFDLNVPFETFACVIWSTESQLERDVLTYFQTMLSVKKINPPSIMSEGSIRDDSVLIMKI